MPLSRRLCQRHKRENAANTLADAVSRQNGQLTIARAVSLALDARGYIQPLVQDVLLQAFGGLMLSSEVDIQSANFRGSRASTVSAGVGVPGC